MANSNSTKFNIPTAKVESMYSASGNPIANQFEITTQDGRFFQSYETIIAFIANNGEVTVNTVFDHSPTTSKYRNRFLGEDTKTTKAKVANGEYKQTDLNTGRN